MTLTGKPSRMAPAGKGGMVSPSGSAGGQPQDSIEQFGGSVPLGRPGQPVEIAPIFVFLASQEASYVTGETYGATGGTGLA